MTKAVGAWPCPWRRCKGRGDVANAVKGCQGRGGRGQDLGGVAKAVGA